MTANRDHRLSHLYHTSQQFKKLLDHISPNYEKLIDDAEYFYKQWRHSAKHLMESKPTAAEVSLYYFICDERSDEKKACELIQQMKIIPMRTSKDLIHFALSNKNGEIALALINRDVPIPVYHEANNPGSSGMSVLVYSIVKATECTVNDSKRKSLIKFIQALLSKGFYINERFILGGKSWSLLSWAFYHNDFTLTEILLTNKANPILPTNPSPLSPVSISTALEQRIKKSIDEAEQNRIDLQKKLNDSELRMSVIIAEFNERFYLLQKEFLDDCLKKSNPEDYKSLSDDYSEAIEALKKTLYESENERVRERAKGNIDKSTAEIESVISEHLVKIKIIIEECALKFIGCSIATTESLKKYSHAWLDNYFKNRDFQDDVNSKYQELIMNTANSDEILRKKINKLKFLKDNLLTLGTKGNEKLREYFIDSKQLNHIDENGFSPLHYACMLDDIKLAKALVDKGAGIPIKNSIFISQNKVYSMQVFLKGLRPDHYRLFSTIEKTQREGMEGIIHMGLKRIEHKASGETGSKGYYSARR